MYLCDISNIVKTVFASSTDQVELHRTSSLTQTSQNTNHGAYLTLSFTIAPSMANIMQCIFSDATTKKHFISLGSKLRNL